MQLFCDIITDMLTIDVWHDEYFAEIKDARAFFCFLGKEHE